jgi:hypothetical protein
MEFKIKRKYSWIELSIQDGNTSITTDFLNGKEIDNLINELEEIIEELKIQQEK